MHNWKMVCGKGQPSFNTTMIFSLGVSNHSSELTKTDPPMTDLRTSTVGGKFQTLKTNSRGSVGEFSPLKLAYPNLTMKLTKIRQFQASFGEIFCQNPLDLTRFMSNLVRACLNCSVLAISSVIDGFNRNPTWVQPLWSDSLTSELRVWMSSTQFGWVGRRLRTNPTQIDIWTPTFHNDIVWHQLLNLNLWPNFILKWISKWSFKLN